MLPSEGNLFPPIFKLSLSLRIVAVCSVSCARDFFYGGHMVPNLWDIFEMLEMFAASKKLISSRNRKHISGIVLH